jgi:uncharacterized radical SAM superfamily Fe-S cluster-containing enzyme
MKENMTKKSRGIVYYNYGRGALVRLAVSLHSLRGCYKGPVTVLCDKESEAFCIELCAPEGVDAKVIPIQNSSENTILLNKCLLHQHTPYDQTLYIDADTLVIRDPSEAFGYLDHADFAVTQFADWQATDPKISKRIENWKQFDPALFNGLTMCKEAINTGIFVFNRDSALMRDWYALAVKGQGSFIPDEICCNIILKKYGGAVLPARFGLSCKHDRLKGDTVIIHYHGRKHCRYQDGVPINQADLWYIGLDAVYGKPEVQKHVEFDHQLSKNIKHWLAPRQAVKAKETADHAFTIVTACTEGYYRKFVLAVPTWNIKPQFAKAPIIIFYDASLKEDDFDFVRRYFKNVSVLPVMDRWPGASMKERIFATLLYCSQEIIKTPYYCKLDGDVVFLDGQDVFLPEDFDYDLCGHSWGYTKPGRYVDQLEDSWNGVEKSDYGTDLKTKKCHPRISSFVCMHKTSFFKAACEKMGPRLRVPSHDTTAWFYAEKMGKWRGIFVKGRGVDTRSTLHGLKEVIGRQCQLRGGELMESEMITDNIQIEITTRCNMGCNNCCKLCGVAPVKTDMTVEQIGRFMEDVAKRKRPLARIDIIGGEPTLHKDLRYIIDVVKPYKDRHPDCIVRLSTNGFKVEELLRSLPKWLVIRNSHKTGPVHEFGAIMVAPADIGIADAAPCSVPWRCGAGLSRHGYFICGTGASIARVFGIDCGAMTLAEFTEEKMKEQIKQLCRFCGNSSSFETIKTKTEMMTDSWKKALGEYTKKDSLMRSI